MVAVMELSEDMADKTRKALAEAAPYVSTPVFVEVAQFFDRLSPPAPEVDEATKIWREMRARGLDASEAPLWAEKLRAGQTIETCEKTFNAERTYLRTALSELIASKDAEIAEWKAVSDCAKEQINDLTRRAEKAESDTLRWHNAYEIAHGQAMSNGSELAALRAENAKPVAVIRFARDTPGNENEMPKVISCNWQPDGEYPVYLHPSPKAAERNTAEPEKPCTCHPDDNPPRPCPKKYALDECRAADTDTTPEVDAPVDSGMDAEAVEQAELLWAQLPVNRKWTSIPTHEKALVCHLLSTYRTEAEARGRREALEALRAVARSHSATFVSLVDANMPSIEDLMTEPKP